MGVLSSDSDSILCYLGLSGLLKLTLAYLWEKRRPAEAYLVGRVTELHLYPLKSARNVKTNRLQCSSARGLSIEGISDRELMVVTSDNKMLTARQDPRLFGIMPKIVGSTMYLTAPGRDEIKLDLNKLKKTNNVVDTDVHGTRTKGVDCGDEIADWLTGYLQRPGDGSTFRMLYSAPNIYKRKQVKDHDMFLRFAKAAKEEDLLSFQDSIGVHLCTDKSVSDLNTRLANPIEVMRFRPNIVLETSEKPYAEDEWHDVFIGDNTRFKAFKCADRCVMPTIDINTFKRDDSNEPLKTLKSYRNLLPGYGPLFGLDLVVERPGTIKVGDEVFVTKSKPLYVT